MCRADLHTGEHEFLVKVFGCLWIWMHLCMFLCAATVFVPLFKKHKLKAFFNLAEMCLGLFVQYLCVHWSRAEWDGSDSADWMESAGGPTEQQQMGMAVWISLAFSLSHSISICYHTPSHPTEHCQPLPLPSDLLHLCVCVCVCKTTGLALFPLASLGSITRSRIVASLKRKQAHGRPSSVPLCLILPALIVLMSVTQT